MKQTIIFLAGIVVLGLSGLITISSTTEYDAVYGISIEQDEVLEIEDWMMSRNYWLAEPEKDLTILSEFDSELEIENWMVKGKFWD